MKKCITNKLLIANGIHSSIKAFINKVYESSCDKEKDYNQHGIYVIYFDVECAYFSFDFITFYMIIYL